MNLSIVIPTYNRSELLKKSLNHLSCQINTDLIDYEIVIVDDGSTDDTKKVVNDFSKSFKNIKFTFRKRDEYSSRARARNIGINLSAGEIITFLDTGVLVPKDFVALLFNKLKEYDHTNLVIYHYVLGMYIDPEKDNTSILDELNEENLKEITTKLIEVPEWIDRRVGLFDFARDNLNNLAAPWSVGWTAAYTTSKKLLLTIGGFDETFLGWGAEDTDLSYRLFNQNTIFIAEREAIALHIPHVSSSESSLDKEMSNKRNELKLHRKNFKFDTELYLFYPGPYYSQALNKYNNLMLQYLLPRYKMSLILYLNQLLEGIEKSVLIGSDVTSFISKLNITDIFIQNKNMINYLKEYFPSKNFHYLLGADTPFNDKHFDMVILTDYYRMFGKVIVTRMIDELSRISKQIVLTFTDEFESIQSQVDDASWLTFEDMKVIIQLYKYDIYKHEESDISIINITTNI